MAKEKTESGKRPSVGKPSSGGGLFPPQLAKEIRRMIKRGDFQPGDHLRTTALAKYFGVSRGPVREALRLLESAGLVEVEPQRGAFVARLENKETAEVLGLRGVLWGYIAELCAQRATEEEIARMSELAGEIETLARDPATTPRAFLNLAEELQRVVMAAGRSTRTSDLVRNLSLGAPSYFAPLSVATRDMRMQEARQYRELALAIATRDPRAAFEAGLKGHGEAVERARELALVVSSPAATVDNSSSEEARALRGAAPGRKPRRYPARPTAESAA